MNWLGYIALGLCTGIVSGFLGLGGGIIMVPMLVYIYGLTQHQAQGTSLAIMIPPIGLLAAWRYYVAGNVQLSIALFVCIGFFFGGYIGAMFSHLISDAVLKKVFGVVLLLFSIRLIVGK
ncbi:MAG: sulfite exporter TauE/SafE family protein [Candidatus Omnitrophica bacterium]|nr:sulfite exporter TauE/SafE family protein [Candidatus Omnitrophota bacterium]